MSEALNDFNQQWHEGFDQILHQRPERLSKSEMDEKMKELYHKNHTNKIAPHILGLLETPPGGRNLAMFKAAKDLKKCGYSISEASCIIERAPMISSSPAIEITEIAATIASAFNA